MFDKIFRRVETKYVLDEEQYQKIMNKLSGYIEKDKYYYSTVGNLYFDTDNNDLIIKSIEKPEFKEKLRVRCYGVPTMDSDIFFELKNKYKGIVGKRRNVMSLRDFYNFLETSEYNSNDQIMRELVYHLNYYKAYPKIYIAYDRYSYKGKDDENFRITFDSNLRSRRDDLRLESGSDGELYFDTPHYIMEVKALGSMPLWFTKILSEEKIYKKSFSKYGNIYMKECGVKC